MIYGVWCLSVPRKNFPVLQWKTRFARQKATQFTHDATDYKSKHNMKQISSDGIAEGNREGKL